MKALPILIALGAVGVIGWVFLSRHKTPTGQTAMGPPLPPGYGAPSQPTNNEWGAAASIVQSLAPAITAYVNKPAPAQTTPARAQTASDAL